MTFLAGLFLLALAFVHLAIWLPPFDERRRTYDARYSRLLVERGLDVMTARRAAVLTAGVVALLFFVSGFAAIRGATWSGPTAAGAAALSLALSVLYFQPWLSLLLVVDLAVIVAVL